MKISRCSNSRIQTTDFTNLKFGTVFSDHMLICKYKDGKWLEVEIKSYGPIEMNPRRNVSFEPSIYSFKCAN